MQGPQALGLGAKDWRPGQQLAIRTALHAKTRHVVVQSPTGSGKSLIAAGIMRLDGGRAIVLTGTKGLEDQYLTENSWLTDLRGMSNYECLVKAHGLIQIQRKGARVRTVDEGPCHTGMPCDLKDDGCTYFDARRAFLGSHHGLTNYSCWLAQRRYGKGLGVTRRLILDEAHNLPEELMAAYRIEIRLDLLRDTPAMPQTWQAWRDWAAHRLGLMKATADLPEDQRTRRLKAMDSLRMLSTIDETWAWDVYDQHVVFEPCVPRLLMPLLGDAAVAPSLVYLSATITRATLRLLDIADDDITFKVMASRFPVARRPVYLVPCTRVDYRMSGEQIAWWLSRIDKIIGKRLDRRGIIHTVSYQRAQDILKGSQYRGLMLAPRRASELPAMIAKFRTTKPPVILLSPSIATGFNFPFTDAEYQIIPKMPFPDTRSAIARARIAATEGYRDYVTAQAVVQMAGRVMRDVEDQGETFVLDDHARWFLPKAKGLGLLPESFTESLVWCEDGMMPSPPPRLKEKE